MAFSSYDSIIAAIASGNSQDVQIFKNTLTQTAGRWYSHWTSSGYPSAGATPATGAGAVPTNSTTGAILFTSPTGTNKKHLLRVGIGGPTAGMIMIYDRLCHTSGLSGTSTSAQTVASTALTRYTSGVGVLCGLEVYSALGSTSRTATISYTDQDGNTGNSGTITIPTSAQAGSLMIPMSMAAGDTGVRAVATVTLDASTGTAGDFGVTLYYPLAIIAYPANGYIERDLVLQMANLPQIQSSACLGIASFSTTTSSGIQFGYIGMAEG